MDKLVQFTFLLLFSIAAKAQVNGSYAFSKLNGTYTDLPVGKTTIRTAWTNPFANLTFSVPLGFDVFSTPTDASQFTINSQGIVTYNTALPAGTFYISAFGDDTYGVAASQPAEASYILEGTNANHILKIQFKGAGFIMEGVHNSYMNFQLWLYENGDIIEMRYGPSLITSGQAVPGDIGIYYDEGVSTMASIELYGTPANPTTGTGQRTDGQHLSNVPTDGTIYRFTPHPLGIENTEAPEKIVTTYNPAEKEVLVKVPGLSSPLACDIYNIAGQRLYSTTLVEKTNRVSVNGFTPGFYIIKTTGKNGINISKLLL